MPTVKSFFQSNVVQRKRLRRIVLIFVVFLLGLFIGSATRSADPAVLQQPVIANGDHNVQSSEVAHPVVDTKETPPPQVAEPNAHTVENDAQATQFQRPQQADEEDNANLNHQDESLIRNAAARHVSKGIQCPPYDPDALDALQIPLKHLPRKKKTSVAEKYNRRAHNCASNGIWNRVTIEDHHKILHNIARLGQIEQGSYILDWGSGCGHSMQFLFDEKNVSGVGIDVSNLTIAYAIANTSKTNLHCVADGTKMAWIPSNRVDHAFSFGSIYHVYNRTMFCHVLRQLVRIVRPGGTVYNGWTENAEYKRAHVAMCLEDLPVSFKIHEERVEFANVQIFPLKAHQDVPNTYSLVIVKNADADKEDATKYVWDQRPIECGVHICEKRPVPAAISLESWERPYVERGEIPQEKLEVRATDAPTTTAEPTTTEAPPPPLESTTAEPTAAFVAQQEDSGEVADFEGWPQCPAYDPSIEDRQIPLAHLPRGIKTSVSQKYDRRANKCGADGVWHKITINDHEAILHRIAQLMEVKRDQVLFDWGSGCGHHLAFMHQHYRARGLGIDVSNRTIAYAIANTSQTNRHCVADGTKLEWIPSNFFDHAYSFGSIYHVYNKTLFCHVLREMVRIVKPGGKVYNGWTENKEFRREDVTKCILGEDFSSTDKHKKKKEKVKVPKHMVEVLEEASLFKHVKVFPLKQYREEPNTYSILVTKAEE